MAAFKVGDILRGKDRENAFHPIIFYEEIKDSEDFYGCIISHAPAERYAQNVLMLKEHFENSAPHTIRFEPNTHLVQRRLFKTSEWGPFPKSWTVDPRGN